MFIFSRVIRYLPLALAAAAIVAPGAQATSAPESRLAAYVAAHWKHEDAIYGAKPEVSSRLSALLEAHWNREDRMYAAHRFAGTKSSPRSGAGVVATVAIPAGTGGLAVGEGAVWSVSDTGPVLTRIDPGSNAVAATIELQLTNACPAEPPGCGEVTAGNGAVWVTHANDDTVSRLNPQTNEVSATIKVGSRPMGVAVSPGAVWVANRGGPSVSRIDPSTNQVVATIRLGPRSAAGDLIAVAASSGAVWVTMVKRGAVMRIDPATNTVAATINLSALRSGQPCGFLAASQSAVWATGAHCPAASSGYGVATRIDARTNKPTRVVAGLKAPIGVAVGLGSLWVADIDAKSVVRINPGTGRIVSRVRVGGFPIRLGIGFGSVWARDDTGRVLRISP